MTSGTATILLACALLGIFRAFFGIRRFRRLAGRGMLLAVAASAAAPAAAQITQKEVDQLIKDLESDQFVVRQKATDALQDAAAASLENARLIERSLRAKLAEKPTLELVRRIQAILAKIFALGPHYKCYEYLGETGGVAVKMTSQFKVNTEVNVGRIDRLCAPALKLPAGTLTNPPAAEFTDQLKKLEAQVPHLARYSATSNEDFDRKVDLETQVATDKNIEVIRIEEILTPALKRVPPDVAAVKDVPADPHYECHVLFSTDFHTATYDLLTQFGVEQRRTVQGPFRLCSPTLKNAGPADTRPQRRRQRRALEKLQSKWPHLACFSITRGQSPATLRNVTTQFGIDQGENFQGVDVGPADFLCMPVYKRAATSSGAADLETDVFPNSTAQVTLDTPYGSETVDLNGPSRVLVNLLASDWNRGGLDSVVTYLVQMDLTGTSKLLGPIALSIRNASQQPFEQSIGEIEETRNITPGFLDLPPFTAGAPPANSYFDVFFQIQLLAPPAFVPAQLRLLHNDVPKQVEGVISHKPPLPNESYANTDVVPLLDGSGNSTGITVSRVVHRPGPLLCDSNGDAEITSAVIKAILARLNTVALRGDPLDADGDGRITANDARICALHCLKPNCAP